MTAVSSRANRVDRMARVLSEQEVDLLLVTPSADLLYLVGYGSHPSERPTVLAVTPEGTSVLVMPQLEAPRVFGWSDLDVRSYVDGADPYDIVQALVTDRSKPIKVAICDQTWASVLLRLQALFPAASFMPASSLMRELRMLKDPEEMEMLHEAGRRADHAFGNLVRLHFAGLTEVGLSEELSHLLSETGLARADWGPIVASGPNAASPHHITGDRQIREGDAVVVDFGGVFEGYQADITRTIHVGPPGADFLRVYGIILKAQQSAFEASRPGNTTGDVDKAARDVIDETGFGQYFIHRTGHGLGLDTHEEPYIVAGSALTLEPGMTFSVEPGVYLPGRFGVRVEDTVAVYEDGPRRFNHATRELQIVH